MTRTAFSALLAFSLLAIYLIGVGQIMLDMVTTCWGFVCPPPESQNQVSTAGELRIPQTALMTIGALISAVVVSALAITPSGQPVLGRQIALLGSDEPRWLQLAVNIYLLAWLLWGGLAFLLGTMVYPGVDTFITDLGQAWFGTAVVAAYAFFKLEPPGDSRRVGEPSEVEESDTVRKLKQKIADRKIVFDSTNATRLRSELLNQNTGGTQVTPALQSLILELCDKTTETLRVSDLIRTTKTYHAYDGLVSRHAQGKAVDFGNEDIASDLLPRVATPAEVKRLGIDEIIFDATVAGESDANKWNFDGGSPHKYDESTLSQHKDHIHIAVR